MRPPKQGPHALIVIPWTASFEAHPEHINQWHKPYLLGRPTSLNLPAKTVSLIIDTEGCAQVRKAKYQLRNLQSRSQSREFADVRIDKSKGMIFRLPLEFHPGIPLKELQNGYRVATPAGKLYIAAIMQKYYQPFGERLLTKLLTNKDLVLCKTGPSPRDVPVSQIARSLLATGKFETFALEE